MRQKLLYAISFVMLLAFTGVGTSSCSPQYKRTKRMYRSLDSHASCPDYKPRKKMKHKPMKGGKKRKSK